MALFFKENYGLAEELFKKGASPYVVEVNKRKPFLFS